MGNNRQKELVSFKLLVDKGGIGNSSHILDETFGARATQSKSDKATPKHKILIQKDKWFIFVLWQIIRRSVAMYGFKKWEKAAKEAIVHILLQTSVSEK